MRNYPLRNLLGAVLHPWDLIFNPPESSKTKDLQAAVLSTLSGVRVYSDTYAIKSADNTTYRFNPEGRGYMLDTALMDLKNEKADLFVLYCVQNPPDNIRKELAAAGIKSSQYRHPNTDAMKPDTWAEGAADMGVLAGRAGKNANGPDYPLFVSPNWWETKQVMLKGAGFVDETEFINEGDNPWTCDLPLNGAEYGVALNEAYKAVKKADPQMIVSSSGVMTAEVSMLRDIKAWAAANNGGKLPFDEYQFHCYPWGWPLNIASALPPELSLVKDVEKVVQEAGDGLPCIVGEWGYDLHPDSPIGIRPFGGYTAEQIRSWWCVRALLGFAVVGAARAFYYRQYQDYGTKNDANGTQFETSALFVKDDNDVITRRLNGDAFAMLRDTFGDIVWERTIQRDDFKTVYVFALPGGKKLYTGWSVEGVSLVTVNGTNRAALTERTSYMFILPSDAGTYTEYVLDDSGAAVWGKKPSVPGQMISLRSKPFFVLYEPTGGTPAPQPEPQPEPTPEPTKTLLSKWYKMVDGKRLYMKLFKTGVEAYVIEMSRDYAWYKV